ncbi:DUF956 family protein [Lactobacillus sp. XV13L]|nr:DUF956 family protein [Lactobacillus sp. XV13L]
MVESSNTTVELTTSATWFRGVATYGKAMVGNKAFEFYNERNIADYVQIPWAEVTYVVADVRFGGRYIPRFEVRTRKNGAFTFSTRNNKKTLHAMRSHVPAERMRQALGLWQKIKGKFRRK